MAELLNDNFETGDLSAWTGSTAVSVVTGISGMQGVYCAEFAGDTSNLYITHGVAQDEIYVAFDFIGINATGAYGPILLFRAAAGAPDYARVLGMLYANGSGVTPIQFKLEAWGAYFADPGVLATHDVFLQAGTKYHIEVRYKASKTDGIFQVMLDGVMVIDVTGVATCPAATTVTDVVKTLFGAGSSDSMYFHADQIVMDDAAWPDTYVIPPLAIIGSVPIKISLDGVIGPTFIGVNIAVVGSVALQVDPTAVVILANPLAMEVIGSVGIRVRPAGVISEPVSSIHACIGSVKLGIGIIGVVRSAGPIAFSTLAIVGSVGIGINATGVVGAVVPSTLSVIGSVNLRIGIAGVTGGALPTAPLVLATIGSVKLGVGIAGVVRSAGPIVPPVLAIIGSVGTWINVKGVVGAVVPSALSVIGSVEIRIGEFRVPELTVVQLLSPADLTLAAITGSVGIEAGPAGVIALATPSTYAVPTLRSIEGTTINIKVAGVIALIHPQILEVIGDIEIDVGVGGGSVDPGVFATYALTGIRGEPSIYSNFPFNSYAQYRGQYFGAGEDGIYMLEGEDDAGDEIHSGVKIGPVNFSTDREKRLRLLRLGGKTVGAQVKVSNGNGSAGYYDVVDGRAGVSREVQGREITVDITDFESLDHLEIVPLILSKR